MRSKRKTPRCHRCGVTLPGPRTIVGGQWTCSDCTAELDAGRPLPRLPKMPRRKPHEVPPGQAPLFDPDTGTAA